jgi:DNA-directed RNA polymerase subunit RPC12/RpoP
MSTTITVIMASRENLYTCFDCSSKFTSQRLLRRHQRGHEVRQLCPYCDQYFKTAFLFQLHQKTHTVDNSTQTSPKKSTVPSQSRKRRKVPKAATTVTPSPESTSAMECGTTTPGGSCQGCQHHDLSSGTRVHSCPLLNPLSFSNQHISTSLL